MNNLIAIILGGGAGTRLYPLTKLRSKPAVPLGGKYRLIDVPISSCINSGINSIFVLTQYNSASLNRHIAHSYRFDSFRNGFVTVLAAEQTPSSTQWYQGTADAVRQSLPHLTDQDFSHVLILSGDQLYSMDYRKIFDKHISSGAGITLGTIPVTAEDAPAFGILKTNDEEEIVEFYEKPPLDELGGKESLVSEELQSQGRIYLASMGIYLFDREILERALLESEEDHDFGKQIIPDAIRTQKVVSYPFTGYWSDLGTVRSFYEANLMLAQPLPEFSLYDKMAPLYTNARMLPPAKIHNSVIENSLISEGSLITKSEIIGSVIGLRTYVEEGARIKDSVIMGFDQYSWLGNSTEKVHGIGENARIENAIIDKNARIGPHCVITNTEGVQEGERGGIYIRDGIVVVTKDARVPDHTVI